MVCPLPCLLDNQGQIIQAQTMRKFLLTMAIAQDIPRPHKHIENLRTPKPMDFSTEMDCCRQIGKNMLLVMVAFLLINPPLDLFAGLPQHWTVCAQLGLVLAEVDFMPKQKARNLTRQPTWMKGLFRCCQKFPTFVLAACFLRFSQITEKSSQDNYYPRCFMYGIFPCIWVIFGANVDKR